MYKSFSFYLEELKNLNLPIGKYAIFGSGPIAVRGLRDTSDLDLVVKNDLYKQLCDKYPNKIKTEPFDCIQIGNLEIAKEISYYGNDIDEIIDTAEIIDGFPFVRLEYILDWKNKKGREKDFKDIKLIQEYLKKHNK